MRFGLIVFFLSFSCFAQNNLLVMKLRGTATADGKSVQEGEMIQAGVQLSVAEKSWIRLRSVPGDDIVIVSANSSIRVGKNEAPQLEGGMLRWISGKIKKKFVKGRHEVRTAQATFGVRGTDFIVVANPLLGESEIVCFDGSVDFNSNSGSGGAIIEKGQWGGLGGRFGQVIGPRINLPENVLKHFSEAVPEN